MAGHTLFCSTSRTPAQPWPEFDDARVVDAAAPCADQGDGLQPVEANAAGGAGVHVQPPLATLNDWAVAVPVDDDLGIGLWTRLRELVNHVKTHARQRHIRMQAQSQAAEPFVVVSVDSVERCDRAQTLQDVGAADIAGVQDGLHTNERIAQPWIQVAVRVGDDADEHVTADYVFADVEVT